jgi:PAS domain S-box-containing protein
MAAQLSLPPSGATLEAILTLVAARPDQLAATLDSSPAALIAFDANRVILYANASAETLFRHDRGALEGKSTDTLLPERLRQPEAPPMVPVVDVMRIDLAGLRRDGTELQVEWIFGSTSTPSGPVFVMTVRDRAAVDRAIEELRRSEERFRLLVDGVHEYAIFMLDPDGLVSSWNKGAERIKGYAADEIIGIAYEIFFTPEDRASGAPQRLLLDAVRDGSQEVQSWRVRKDGSRFLAAASLTALRSSTGELRGFAKITRDLTQQLKAEELARNLSVERAAREAAQAAEQRVRASEDRLRRLQRVTAALSEAATPSDVANVVLDQALLAFEASGGALYGLSPDGRALCILAERGHPSGSVTSFEDIQLDALTPLTDAARERTPTFYANFEDCAAHYPELRENIRAGGFEASAALPLLTHGKVQGALGIRFPSPREFDSNDRALLLTLSELCAQALDRARLFAAERAAREAAESANRAKDEFLAMLGHELRNPLAPIVIALDLMKAREGDATKKTREIIDRQVTHLARLVDDLLDVSRITQGKVELKKARIEIAPVVARAIELASALLEERRQHLTLSVPDHGLVVDGDPTRLAQVVSNLLTNAAKYTAPGGHIHIEVRRSASRVVLTVRDDGIGISPAMLPRIFDIFAQEHQGSDRSQGGLGLGLTIVKSLVSMHGGTVSALSEGRGKGSLFTVELPVAGAEKPLLVEPSATAQGACRSGFRVLVVDDNADAAEMLSDWLQAAGFEVHAVHDGQAAIDAVESFAPHAVLLDIGLPVLDGFEVARRVRERMLRREPFLIAVTGYGQEADRERSTREGFRAHLVKPVDLDALTNLLTMLPQSD